MHNSGNNFKQPVNFGVIGAQAGAGGPAGIGSGTGMPPRAKYNDPKMNFQKKVTGDIFANDRSAPVMDPVQYQQHATPNSIDAQK